MIEQTIIDKILRGKKVHILVSVSGTDNTEVDKFRLWLRQFQHSQGEGQFINCNTIVSRDGSEGDKLDVEIGPVPLNMREHFAGTLGNQVYDSPLMIRETCEPTARQ
jgi:hypothetical protein